MNAAKSGFSDAIPCARCGQVLRTVDEVLVLRCSDCTRDRLRPSFESSAVPLALIAQLSEDPVEPSSVPSEDPFPRTLHNARWGDEAIPPSGGTP